ncbi:MAG: tetratricopeptide repeat protein [Casimicrobiaceae bacterium]
MARDQRRLAAIVSTDTVGYSRLMGLDEAGTLAGLKAHLRELVDPKIAEYGGRTVKSMGDGLLLEFPSVVDAVRCAVDVQRGMAERNATVSEETRIIFRIGINVGDIIIDGEDIVGDGVNVAARLQTLAEPGGICVSRVVRDQVLDKLSFAFDDVGPQEMKNITRPIEVYRVLLGDNAAAGPRQPALRRQASAKEPPSIAVLPFVNRSHDEEDEYFSDGLADELLNVLAKIRGLRVAARTSSFQFKGKNDDIAVIGRKLNVATVLEGSVRKSGTRLRISVQLVNVADGYHLWSERYDRTLEDIFAVQDDIAQSVVKELRARLLGEVVDAQAATAVTAQVAAAVKGRATDPEAHRLYLQARHFLERRTRDESTKAIGHLEQALERDPTFALAWVELGRAYQIEANVSWTPVVEGYARAREAVARALALEPDLAEGHTLLGWIQMTHDWDWRGAQASFARAMALAPRDAAVLRGAGTLALNLGRLDEAIVLYRRAIEQDPLSAISYHNLGMALDANGDFVEAEQAYRKALEFAPQRAATRAYLALNLVVQGRGEEALAEALREPEEWARLWASAIIAYSNGHAAAAAAALRELIAKDAEASACQIAQVYAAHGETDLAFEWLERAYVQRDGGLSEMKSDRLRRRLHADPRWGAFLRKMGLPE